MALTLHILLAYADTRSSKAYGGCYRPAGMQAIAVTRREVTRGLSCDIGVALCRANQGETSTDMKAAI